MISLDHPVRLRLIHITRCRGLSRKLIRNLLKLDPSLEKIYTLSPQQIAKFLVFPLEKAILFHTDLHDIRLKHKLIVDLNRYQIITIVDENYPTMLNTINDAPLVLYAIGDTGLLKYNKMISVIGTRKPSMDAMEKMELIVRPLVEEKWLIVSGLALGIDSMAHLTSLKYKGKTIAVLGSGFHHIYPRQNTNLFHDIARNGVLVSEYPPDTPPKKYHFPERNRIISGLSFGTLVMEATEKSGTMITVDQALDQGREVYAVPGSPFIPQTRGCHKIIQEGAKLVYSSTDILEDWQVMSTNYK